MARSSAPDSNLLIEVGQLLYEARIKQGLSMESMCKKLGVRADQIQAIEQGDAAFFQKRSTQPLIWFARLYAKKLGVALPDMEFNNNQRTQGISPQAQTKIPAFLIKNTQPTEK